MHAIVKYVHSPDIIDLRSHQPEDPEAFCYLLQIMIGPDDHEGEESFDVQVVTPQWLREKHGEDMVLSGRHYLIVFKYDFNQIMDVINRYCESCSAKNWEEFAAKMSRFGSWEFEDYIE